MKSDDCSGVSGHFRDAGKGSTSDNDDYVAMILEGSNVNLRSCGLSQTHGHATRSKSRRPTSDRGSEQVDPVSPPASAQPPRRRPLVRTM